MKSESLLITGGILITHDEGKIIEDGAIFCEGNTIKNIASSRELRQEYPDCTVVDASNKVVMPGNINAHTHLYSTLARGIGLKDPPPTNFVQILERLWWKLDRALTEDDVYYSALIGGMDSIRHGTTTIFDHHASANACPGSLDVIADALGKIGLRSCLCYEVSDRDKKQHEGIKENQRFIEKCQSESNDLLSATFGMHASFTISERTMKQCSEVGNELGSGFHIHVAEDRTDVQDCFKKYEKHVVERLEDEGILGPKSIAAHCIYTLKLEWGIINNTLTNVVHNPQSNSNNAVGTADVLEMLKKGTIVGLGTDGFSPSMFHEMSFANVIHKLVKTDPRVGYGDITQMAFENNSKIANKFFSKPLGKLKTGQFADIIILDYQPPTPLNEDSFLGHLFFGLSRAKVDTVIINGKVVMEDGHLKSVDENEVAAKAKALTDKLWKRF